MDFINGSSLLALCASENKTISEIMLQREMDLGCLSKEAVYQRLARSIEIMKASTRDPIAAPVRSMGGLLGGESQAVWNSAFGAKSEVSGGASQPATAPPLCGSVMSKAIAYSMAVLEVNASMGLIVAAPTAGSSGVIPGDPGADRCLDGEKRGQHPELRPGKAGKTGVWTDHPEGKPSVLPYF